MGALAEHPTLARIRAARASGKYKNNVDRDLRRMFTKTRSICGFSLHTYPVKVLLKPPRGGDPVEDLL
jgi:hypothetical protein